MKTALLVSPNLRAIVPSTPRGAPRLGEVALTKLERACDALGRADLYDRAAEVLGHLTRGWASLPVLATPPWPSDITDDGSPFELSFAFGGGRAPELRVLCEPQEATMTALSNWRAGLALNERLATEFGADLTAFNLVRDLFAPMREIPVRFALWHAAELSGHAPSFKAYVNPWVVGAQGAPRLVNRALARLGQGGALRDVGALSNVVYFSLDLVAGGKARTKVYTAHPGGTAQGIAAQVCAASGERAEVASAIEALGGTSGPLTGRPVQTCHAFRANGTEAETTVYVPVRSYVDHDAEALERACAFLRPGDAEALRDVVHSIADRPLDMGRGMITYVALRPTDNRITVYVSPELYSIAAPRRSSLPASPKHSMVRGLRPASVAPAVAMPPAAARPGTTVAELQKTISLKQKELAAHPFLEHLEHRATLEDVRAVVPRVAFFVMCFQDVLRLVHEHTTDPQLKAIAKTHRREDKGHELWYLHDLDRLGASVDIKGLFSEELARIRDVAYTQIADALHSSDDRSRLCVVLALEAAGAEFFRSVIAGVDRLAHVDGLLYFARPHQKVEQSHGLFDADASREMGEIAIPPEVLPEVLAVIDRTYASMVAFADDLLESLPSESGPLKRVTRLVR